MNEQNRKPITAVTDREMILPNNADLERQVLGELLFGSNKLFEEIEMYLSTNTFYTTKNALIFAAIQATQQAGEQIDGFSVINRLKADKNLEKAGGMIEVMELITSTPSTAYALQHAQMLKQLEMQRGMVVLCNKLTGMAQNPTCDIADVIETAERGLTELQTNTTDNIVTMPEGLIMLFDYLRRQQSGSEDQIISTGLQNLDLLLDGGFRAPDLIIIGARPSVGKTQFAVSFAEAAARQNKKVLFVSIEMTATQLVARMAAKGVSYSAMRKGQLLTDDWQRLEQNAGALEKYYINIADAPDCRNLSYIRSCARRMARKSGIDMLIIDYLQLIRTSQRFERRYIEVGYITGELKNLAKELNIPIILLAQLSRPAQGQEMNTPRLENLRESGDIEQDADIVIFPHRPSLYNPDITDSSGRSWQGRGKLIVAKNREGQRDVECIFYHDRFFKQFADEPLQAEQTVF